MADDSKNIEFKGAAYRLRIMVCVVVAEAIMLGVFNLWPLQESTGDEMPDMSFSENALTLDEVVMTRQESRPPPPPRPQIPIPVPNDKIIEDQVIELDDISMSEFSDSLSIQKIGEQGNSDQVVSNPQSSPSVIRIVEPTVPEQAKAAEIKAEIWVNFLVNRDGRVEDASITKIKLYDNDSGEPRLVNKIGYGITEATLKAALEWKFHPAINNGNAVKAYSTQVFTYGFSH